MADQAKLVPQAPPDAPVTAEEQQAVQAIIMGVDPAKAAKSVVDTAQTKSGLPAITTQSLGSLAMNGLPAAPMNSFAAALEKHVGAFDAAALPPVPTKSQSPFSIAALTHKAVLNALGGGASAPTALAPVAVEPAAPA